jgi:hypothetical protein
MPLGSMINPEPRPAVLSIWPTSGSTKDPCASIWIVAVLASSMDLITLVGISVGAVVLVGATVGRDGISVALGLSVGMLFEAVGPAQLARIRRMMKKGSIFRMCIGPPIMFY